MATKYRNVTQDAEGILHGEQTMGVAGWVLFSGSPDLMKIAHVFEAGIPARLFRRICTLSDGYGGPMDPDEYYDWSGIRDSSTESRAAMCAVAEKWWGERPWPFAPQGGLR